MSDDAINWILNGRSVYSSPGVSLLEACRDQGVILPALCSGGQTGHSPSCMTCLVEVEDNIIPACGNNPEEGMSVITNSRKTSDAVYAGSEMLMNEHGGDCFSPCSTACRANLDTALISRLILNGQSEQAAGYAFRKLVFPELLSRLCHASCQNVCRRKKIDQAVNIPVLHGRDLLQFFKPVKIRRNGKTALISGNSPECWSAAHYLNFCGIRVTVLYSGQKTFPVKDESALSELISDQKRLENSGINFVKIDDYHKPDIIPEYLLKGTITGKLDYKKVKEIKETPGSKYILNRIVNGLQIAEELFFNTEGRKYTNNNTQKSPSRVHGFSDVEKKDFLTIHPAPKETSSYREQVESCLLCGCLSGNNCKLKDLAIQTGARQKKGNFLRQLETPVSWGALNYEFAKCINCGLCIKKSLENPEIPTLGQAFKGLDTRIIHKDSRLFTKKEAIVLIRICPVGAFSLRGLNEK